MSVGIVRATYLNIERKLNKLLRLIDYKPQRDTVLLKPNGASAYGHYLLGDYTSPQLLEAFIRMFPDREYIIAEGSAVGMNFEDAARVNGYDRLARKYKNVRLMDLQQEPRVEHRWKFGRIRLPKILHDCEYVNIAKMKTHNGCIVTLGTKNQKGLLDENTKKRFHRMDLQEAVRELGRTVQPDLTIVDGIIALEGNGPNSIAARPKPMGVLVAGRDMTQVDNACIRIMGIPPHLVTHVPEVDFDVTGVKIRSVARKFALPKKEDGFFRFANVYYTLSCSGCIESLSGGLRRMVAPEQLHNLPVRMQKIFRNVITGRMYLFMGKNNVMPKKPGAMLCIGNCSKKFAEANDIPYIPGCPPDPEELVQLFERIDWQ